MLTGVLLDLGARGLVQGLVGVVAAVVLLLGVASMVPVLVVTSLFHPAFAVSIPAVHLPLTADVPAAGSPLPNDAGSAVVEVARRYLGVRYVFGGTDAAVGLDCSGLVQLVYRQLGMALPRTAQQQYAATARVGRDQLQPGDLVFFAHTYDDPHDWVTHVGIYIGNGQQINAPTEGQVVSIQPVFSGFWGAHFTAGGRVASRQSAA